MADVSEGAVDWLQIQSDRSVVLAEDIVREYASESANPITHGRYVVVAGKTYQWSKELREAGLRFDGGSKTWVGTIDSPDRELYTTGPADPDRPWMTPPMVKTGATEVSHLVRDLRKAVEDRELYVGASVKAATGRESWQGADGHLNHDC